jgi:large subunit ribosomal protein L15
VKAHAFSASAVTKIAAAGGSATVVDKKTGEALDA